MIKKLNKKGQGALEYLLIIGGALLVAVIVITLILSINSTHTNQVKDTEENYSKMIDSTIIPPIVTALDCNSFPTDGETTIWLSPSPTKGITKYRIKVGDSIYGTDVVLTSGHLQVISDTVGITTDGEKYYISVAAIKGDYQSAYTSSMSCVAHN